MVQVWRSVLNGLRGFLIGMAELVPGVSGGTVALVVGVYDDLINSASHVVAALVALVKGPDRLASARQHLARTSWLLVIPVLVGMAAALLTVSGVMSAFVTDHPEASRGLFLGMVVVSVIVPLRMAADEGTSWRVVEWLVLIGAAVLAFVLVGLAGSGEVTDPPLLVVSAAAAVAICALVVPGVSGSFFLLAVGLYATTLDAVHARDLAYIAAFAFGAFVGLASFVQVLRWALDNHRRITLLAMAGLMVGSLRALWPWQAGDDEDAPGSMIAPYEPVELPMLLALVGAAVVGFFVWLEGRLAEPAPSA